MDMAILEGTANQDMAKVTTSREPISYVRENGSWFIME